MVRFVLYVYCTCACIYTSDKINNETLILFYLQKGLITNEQKPVINYHFNVIPPQCGCFHYSSHCLAMLLLLATVSLLLLFWFHSVLVWCVISIFKRCFKVEPIRWTMVERQSTLMNWSTSDIHTTSNRDTMVVVAHHSSSFFS